MEAPPILRRLSSNDLAAAQRLSTEAGWNQTIQDWRVLLELAPDGCLAIEVGDELASTATIVSYGTRLAWIGMVLTRAEFRGRGYAQRLLSELLTLADRLGIKTIKLDATEQGLPIYEKLGFRSEQPVERWERITSIQSQEATLGRSSEFAPGTLQLDQKAFGADRSELLKLFSKENSLRVVKDSCLLTRPGRQRSYIGPFIASSLEDARTLIQQVIELPSAHSWYWDLLPNNRDSVALASELSFAPRRHLTRMVRGETLRGEERFIYALGGVELG